MTITADQFKEAARKAVAAGDIATARKLIARAKAAEGQTAQQPAVPQPAAAQPASAMPAQPLPDNPELQWFGPGPTGMINPELYDMGAIGRRFVEGQPAPGDMPAVWDVPAAAAAGLGRGAAALVGLPGTLADLGEQGIVAGINRIAGTDLKAGASTLSSGALQDALSAATGGASEYKGQSVPAQYAGTIGEFIGGGSGAKLGVAAGIGAETAGQLTDQNPWARLLGALAPSVIAGATSAGTRAALGVPRAAADPERLRLAKVLDDFSVPITTGQRIGADSLRKVEAGTARGVAMADEQMEAFTSAALSTIGTQAKRATPEVMRAADDRIGQVFDDVTRGVDVTPDAATLTAMSKTLATYRELAPKLTASPLLQNINREFVAAFRAGRTIPATTLKQWRSNLSKLTTSADDATRTAAVQALEVVDDAMEGALVALGRSADVARLKTARGQWRNYLALQRAVTMAGEDAAVGLISPARLASSVVQQGRAAVAKGQRGDIGELARAGVGVMSPLPTVTAGGVRSIPGVNQMISGGLGASLAGPVGAMVGVAAPGVYNALRAGPLQGLLARMGSREGSRVVDPDIIRTIPGLLAQ